MFLIISYHYETKIPNTVFNGSISLRTFNIIWIYKIYEYDLNMVDFVYN